MTITPSHQVFYITDSKYTEHETGTNHPECPDRQTYIHKAVSESGLIREECCIEPRAATPEEVFFCHPKDYVQLVEEETENVSDGSTNQLSTGDVQICRRSYEVALLAVGGVLDAVDLVMDNICKRVFCNVRPPGHHACEQKGMGFCLFNNVAIGARYAQHKFNVKRVLIVDWDVHHGNGTQDIFYKDPSVFYFSTHEKGIYPLTGQEGEIGEGDGEGMTLNVPIKGGRGSREAVLNAFDEKLIPAMEFFKPDLIFISAGFDGHKNDPLGGFNLETSDFALLTQKVCAIADRFCNGRVIAVLEGGYNLKAIAGSAVSVIREMST